MKLLGKKQNAGFTLLELLVVVTILVILTGILLPYVQGYVDDARYARAKADLDELKNALALYETKRGEAYSTEIDATSTAKLLNRGYITKNPVDPWGSPYDIFGARGEVVCRGPDGKPDTADDIVVPYQPPLACIAAFWLDGNKDSVVDANGIGRNGDTIILQFTRQIRSPFPNNNTTIDNNGEILIKNPSGSPAGQAPSDFDWYDSTGRMGIIWWETDAPNFTPGQSYVQIRSTTAGANVTIIDYNGTPCKNDDVKITAR